MRAAPGVTPAFRGVISACSPIVRTWGRLEVEGLEQVPLSGPTLLAGNHDSWWDPIAIGAAALERRQIQALAKSSLWKYRPVGKVLDGMGQIPINRGKADREALDRAITVLREGACIGIFLEGTRSRGRTLRARSGFGRIAEAVPEAEIVCCAVRGTTDVIRFPARPQHPSALLPPAGGGLQEGEAPAEFGTRLLAEIRAGGPGQPAGPSPAGAGRRLGSSRGRHPAISFRVCPVLSRPRADLRGDRGAGLGGGGSNVPGCPVRALAGPYAPVKHPRYRSHRSLPLLQDRRACPARGDRPRTDLRHQR